MGPLSSALFSAIFLLLGETANAQHQDIFSNDTVSWGTSPLIFSKRATCSGTCAECYGAGSIYCGTSDTCYNPTIGESCCAQYSYSCPDGYYCAPGGLQMECCSNSYSTTQCTNSINGGGSSSGLSTGAKAGIGVGVVLLLIIIASIVAWLCIRRRNRRRMMASAPAPATWQMPQLAGGPGGAQPGYNAPQADAPHGNAPQGNAPQGGYNGVQGGYDGTHAPYNGAQGGYSGAQGGYGGTPGGYDAGGYDNNNDIKTQQFGGGGPPLAGVYTPGGGPQKGEYSGYVPSSHAELAESPPVHGVSPAVPQYYPPATEQDRARAAEMYGSGQGGHNY